MHPVEGQSSNEEAFLPGQAATLTSTVELSVRCDHLPDMDLLSKSDPFCVLYMKDGDRWILVDKTETI